MATLRFLPPGFQDQTEDTSVETQCSLGQTVFDRGWKLDVGIQSACVGKGTCGLCRVKILKGADQLSPYNASEEKHLGNLYYLTALRLSCQCTITGDTEDIVVEVVPKRVRKKTR